MKIDEVFAYLRVDDAAAFIEFCKAAFAATEKLRLTEPGGRIGHAELELGSTVIMVSDEFPELGIRGPASVGGTTVAIHLHVDDADEVIGRAVAAGATVVREAADQFYGERSGVVRDPAGHEWNIGHAIEEVSPEEMQRRYSELLGGQG